MILLSKKNNNYYDFDVELYCTYYPELIKQGYKTKDQLWWHYLNIGEDTGFHFYSLQKRKEHFDKYKTFDEVVYSKNYLYLCGEGLITKEELWLHYQNKGEGGGYQYFHINDRRRNLVELKKKELIKNGQQITNTKWKNTIYYYIDDTCKNHIRTGIQVVSIYLAKQFLKNKIFEINCVFVKWSPKISSLVPCNPKEIDHFLNYGESQNVTPEIYYPDYNPIHLNPSRNIKDSIFFCPELTFSQNNEIPSLLKNYLFEHKIKSIYIVYDIIPLVLPDYNMITNQFQTYVRENLIHANKLITISEFTKGEFLSYSKENNIHHIEFPIVNAVPLPYQYRDSCRDLPRSEENTDDKVVKILLPGTIEPRKQQMVFIKLFNKFILENPEINVELTTFGNVNQIYKEELMKQISLSNGKIQYLGTIDNDILDKLYKDATFLCFISKYEGYGFPISESLWHGTPVLTSEFGSMDEVAKIGGCLRINTLDEMEIYESFSHLIKNPVLLEKMKDEIKNATFTTWLDYAKRIYEEIMSELK
jgi:glycosyltransferase involved in cell wall biosynthesis